MSGGLGNREQGESFAHPHPHSLSVVVRVCVKKLSSPGEGCRKAGVSGESHSSVKARAGRASSVKKTRVWVVCFSWSIVERALRKAKSWKNQWRRQHLFYSRPSLSAALLCAVSVPCSLKILNGKFQKETFHKFEIACHSEECDEILSPSRSVPPGIWIPTLSSISLPVSHLVAISIIRLIIKGHIHTTFITVHCYNCSILLLVNCC